MDFEEKMKIKSDNQQQDATVDTPVPDSRKHNLWHDYVPDEWSVSYIALLVYVTGIVTARFAFGAPAIIVALIGLVFSRHPLRFPKPLVWMAIFFLWSCATYISSDFKPRVYDELYELLKLLLIAFVVVNAVRTPKQALFFLIFVLAAYLIYPVRVTLVNYFVVGYTVFGRAIGSRIYSNSNDLAALTLLQMSSAYGLYSRLKTGWTKRVALGACFLMALVIVLTQSRGAFVAGLVFLGLVIRTEKRKFRLMFGLVAALSIVVMIAPASTFDRFERLVSVASSGGNIADADPEGSAKGRAAVVGIALQISADNPVMGVGFGAYEWANAQYWVRAVDAHSTYLTILAETGVPGLLFFLLIFWSALKDASRKRLTLSEDQSGAAAQLGFLVAGYIAYLVAATFGTYSTLAMTYVHLFAIWALADAIAQPASNSKHAK
jgi:O-antigen ligase